MKKEKINHTQNFLDLKEKEKWLDEDTLDKIKGNAEKEKRAFNNYVDYQIKKATAEAEERYVNNLKHLLKVNNGKCKLVEVAIKTFLGDLNEKRKNR